MKPAYQIPLNKDELGLVGELTVIIGQTDDIMVQTVAFLLKVDRAAANVIMGSSKVADNSKIWSETIRNRTVDEDILWLVELASKEFEPVSRGRNDFIHTVYSSLTFNVGGINVSLGSAPANAVIPIVTPTGIVSVQRPSPLARRVRKTNTRSVSELPDVIARAARLSCLVAHIDHLMAGNQASTSAWLERLAPTLPPRLDTVEERRAKAQRGQHQSSD